MNFFNTPKPIKPIIPELASMLGTDNYKTYQELKSIYETYEKSKTVANPNTDSQTQSQVPQTNENSSFCMFLNEKNLFDKFKDVKSKSSNLTNLKLKINGYISELESYKNNLSNETDKENIKNEIENLDTIKYPLKLLTYDCSFLTDPNAAGNYGKKMSGGKRKRLITKRNKAKKNKSKSKRRYKK